MASVLSLVERFSESVPKDRREELRDFVASMLDLGVPEEEVERAVRSKFGASDGTDSRKNFPEPEETKIAFIDTPDKRVILEAEVDQLWEPRSDKIRQVGLLGDGSGRIKFVSWKSADQPLLDEGAHYRVEGAMTDEYEGRFSVQLDNGTSVEQVEGGEKTEGVEFEGAVVGIKDRSGLIRRCPEEGCTYVLNSGICQEHGTRDGEFDLRIKAYVDDGNRVLDTVFRREETEELLGITLDEGKMMELEEGKEAVSRLVEEELLGRTVRLRVVGMGSTFLVTENLEVEELGLEDVERLLSGL